MSPDKFGSSEFPNPRICRDRGPVHLERLVNLDQLVEQGEFGFAGYLVKRVAATGSPVRAVAELS